VIRTRRRYHRGSRPLGQAETLLLLWVNGWHGSPGHTSSPLSAIESAGLTPRRGFNALASLIERGYAAAVMPAPIGGWVDGIPDVAGTVQGHRAASALGRQAWEAARKSFLPE
jgi:hypothetical protein